jgi:hypothetical protein
MTDPGIGNMSAEANRMRVDRLRALADEASTGKKSDGVKRGVDVLPNWPQRRWLRGKKSR